MDELSIPYMSFMAVLVAIASIMMGKDMGQKLFTLIGMVAIPVFISSIIFIGVVSRFTPISFLDVWRSFERLELRELIREHGQEYSDI